jgi:hypothetical protein
VTIEYEYTEAVHRGYQGLSFSEEESKSLLQGPVADNLADKEEQDAYRLDLEDTKAQLEAAGYDPSDVLLDILGDPELPDEREFRIGEAFAEVILESEFSAKFYWNELRDARNPKGNKTGADLVGFIQSGEETLFLFGEVKTSSEENRPPGVMTGRKQMEAQLKDLYRDNTKKKRLIQYLASKTRGMDASNPFKKAYERSRYNFYRKEPLNGYVLFGVLIRDVAPDENDLVRSYRRLSSEILTPTGLNLLACYIPIKSESWSELLNTNTE